MPRRAKPRPPIGEGLNKHCPLFSYEDYDSSTGNSQWPIGLKSASPVELRKRVAAASLSFSMRIRSIDHTYKRYVKGHKFNEGSASRLDLRIGSEIESRMELFTELICQVTATEPKRQGEIISEWTFLRVPWSIRFLLSCAQKGAFFECTAIARMILEQIAWAAQINMFDDHVRIRGTSATKSIGDFRRLVPSAGKLYGWLSTLAHWEYRGHIKAMHFREYVGERRLEALFASSEFKAKALTLALLLSVIAIRAFTTLKKDEVEIVTSGRKGTFSKDPDQKVFGFSQQATPSELKKVLKSASTFRLLKALENLAPQDADIRELCALARAVTSS